MSELFAGMAKETAVLDRGRGQAALTRAKAWLRDLWFRPASPAPLGALRMGLAAVLLVQACLLSHSLLELYGSSGLVQDEMRRFMLTPLLPVYFDLAALGASLGVPADSLLRLVFLLYVASLSLMLVGFHSRQAVILVWLTHFLIVFNVGYSSSYGVDTFANIFLFYLMFMPMDRAYALDRRLGRVSEDAGEWQRFSLRVLQLHLFLIYFSTGVDKAMGTQWWNGEAIWRAWMLPQFVVFDMSWLAWHPWLARSVTWLTLFFETGYPLLLAWPRTRRLGAAAIVAMHLGIAFTMHLWSFSLTMACLTFCVFLIPAEQSTAVTAPRPMTIAPPVPYQIFN